MELRLPLEMSPGREAACRAVFGTWGFFPNDARKNCPFVLTAFTGWSSERCPGIGFLSRGDREIGVLRNVEPPTRPRLECLRETGLILRCDRKVGNPFQTKQGSRPSRPDQEGRKGSEEGVQPLYDTRNTGDVIISIAKTIGGKVAAAFAWDDFEGILKDAAKEVFQAGGTLFTAPFEEAQVKSLAERGWRPPRYKSFDEFWDQLVERGGWWDPAYQFVGGRRVFKTASGKFEFYSQHLRRTLERVAAGKPVNELLQELRVTAREDQAYLPHYEPARFIGEAKEYPFYLNTFKSATYAGSRGASQPHLQEISRLPVGLPWDSWVEINPGTAKRLGIADGEGGWVESPLGKFKTRARLYPGAMPNVVNVPLGQGHKAYGRWAKGRGENPNQILGEERDSLAGFTAWYATRVKLSKA